MTVTEISKKLNISISRVSNNLRLLESDELINKKKNKDNSVSIKALIEITEDGEIRRKNE